MRTLRFEPRVTPSRWAHLLVPLVTVALTLVMGSVLFALLGKSPITAFYAFFIQPFTNFYSIGEILLKASPLLLIAQGLAIGFRARVWNIGAEGQFIIGAICAAYLAIRFETSDSVWLLPAMILAGMLGGMAWAAIAAVLRTRFNANEILVTFMLSSIALQVLYYMVTGPLKDPQGFNFPQSVMFGDAGLFDIVIAGTRVNSSIFLALIATVLAWVFMQRSLPGFKLLVSGTSPNAARYAGFAERQAVWIGLLAGGAAAGLAGVGEVAGPIGQLQRVLSPGYGFAAIIVAFLGGLHPIGIVFASLFMALIYVGGDMSLVSAGIPYAATTIFQGMLLVFYLASYVFIHYRLHRPQPLPPQTPGEQHA